jgi:hypothetical protein
MGGKTNITFLIARLAMIFLSSAGAGRRRKIGGNPYFSTIDAPGLDINPRGARADGHGAGLGANGAGGLIFGVELI